LAEEVKFIDRGGSHGFVWPQVASEWMTLTEKERMDGAEAIVATGKKLRPEIVIGVQSPDLATAIRYAKHAEKLGADAIIALPPAQEAAPNVMMDYYKEIGKTTQLPFIVQAVGKMNVELIMELYNAIPTMRYVKDEAYDDGPPATRIGPLRQKSGDKLKVWTGGNGRTFIEELRLGFSGTMPTATFADVYAQTFDLWQAGKHKEAMEMHARALLALTETSAQPGDGMKYILYLRGVFKTYRSRRTGEGGRYLAGAAAAALAAGTPPPLGADRLTDGAKQSLKETLDFLKPYLKA
jgi:4-hydroxy-tetrahydrodipicolinate synthase